MQPYELLYSQILLTTFPSFFLICASFGIPVIYTVSFPVFHYKILTGYLAHSFTFFLFFYFSYCILDEYHQLIPGHRMAHHSTVRHFTSWCSCTRRVTAQRAEHYAPHLWVVSEYFYVSWIMCYTYCWGLRTTMCNFICAERVLCKSVRATVMQGAQN